jgi:solute carrier family 35, member F5
MTLPSSGDQDVAAAASMPRAVAPRNHAIGLVLIALVAVIWVASAELIQFIFGASSFSKPYFLTYFSTSLFTLYLSGFVLVPAWRGTIFAPPARSSTAYHDLAGSEDRAAVDDPSDGLRVSGARRIVAYNAEEVRSAAFILAPLFFLSNYTFNLGLMGTSVASSSTISTLSALFGLALGAAMGVERFSLVKLASACMTVLGVAVISMHDKSTGGRDSVLGDVLSVVAAFLYGLYAIQLKKQVPDEESASVAMMFGYLGGIVAVSAWPVFFVLHWTGVELFELPDKRVIGLLLLNALVGTVLSDYLWARSVTLTTPVIATLALSLTLPLSVLTDYFMRGLSFTWTYLIGVALVLAGFVAANVDEAMSSSKP